MPRNPRPGDRPPAPLPALPAELRLKPKPHHGAGYLRDLTAWRDARRDWEIDNEITIAELWRRTLADGRTATRVQGPVALNKLYGDRYIETDEQPDPRLTGDPQ